ncbi:MAG: hypothetical protein H5U24_12190 [Thioclava marina]|nr:hypothetical protein [Thioclava marina]
MTAMPRQISPRPLPLPVISPTARVHGMRVSSLTASALLALVILALPASAQDVEVMRGGKRVVGQAESNATTEPECKTLSTGDTFCKVERNGVSRWVLQGQMQPDFKVGEIFPVYDHSMVMNLNRYDLPPVTGAWRYYVVRGVIYKVGADSHKVLEVMGRAIRR